MTEEAKSIVFGLARHGLTLGAGYLAARGLTVDDSTVQVLASAVVAIIGLVWSALHKKGSMP